ncbi:MAG TPA: PAS-domain containing protein [Dongiaceae bacterium]|nr:PAS-domain containing protein [Dongiaceae bacterium]
MTSCARRALRRLGCLRAGLLLSSFLATWGAGAPAALAQAATVATPAPTEVPTMPAEAGPLILALVFGLALGGAVTAFFLSRRHAGRMGLFQQEKRLRDQALTAAQLRLDQLPVGRLDWWETDRISLDHVARELLSVPADEIDAADFLALLDKSDASRVQRALNDLIGAVRCDLLIRRNDGKTWLRLRGKRLGVARSLWIDDITEVAGEQERLRRLALELSSTLDHLPYPVWRRDGNLAITYCNPAFGQLLDVAPGELPPPGRELNAAARALARRAQKLTLAQSESQQLVVAGQRRLYDLNEFPLADNSLIGFALDQTALEEGQAELSRHIAAHDDVLQSLGTGIVIFGPDRRVKFFNTAYLEQFGLDGGFLRAEPTIEEVLEALRERRRLAEQADFRSFKQEFARHLMTVIQPMEELIHTPSGATFRMVATPHPLGGVILTFEDVTDELALEANYNTLIEVQKETIDHLNEGIAVYGEDGRLKLHNPAFSRLWRLPDEQLANQPHVAQIVDMVRGHFPAREDWRALRLRIIGNIADRELRNLRIERIDGRIIDIAAIPLPDGGKLYKYTDVTDSINMERALMERNEALIAADRLKSEFIANVSYEFRTPLNVIIGYAELLARQYFGALNPRQLDYSNSILDAAQGLLLLISDVIDVAAIEAGYIRLERREIDVLALIDSIQRLFQQRVRSRDLELQIDCALDIGSVFADEQRLKQALSNLISNAIAVAPHGASVVVGARRDNKNLYLGVSLSDLAEGVGEIAYGGEPILASITDSSSVGRSATGGLGIALVKTLIGLHGGRIETDIGAGYRRVTCVIPLAAETAAAEEATI